MKYIYLIFLTLCVTSLVAQPVITSFTPISGTAGTPITITGTGFNATAANNTVYIGGVKAAITAATTTTLTVNIPPSAGLHPISVTVANLTGYSRLPLAILAPTAYPVTGLTFPNRTDFPSFAAAQYPHLADFDGDGKIDVAVSNQGTGGNPGTTVNVYRNISTTGNIVLADPLVLTTTQFPFGIVSADLDGDGKLELISTSSNNSTTVAIFRNTTTGGVLSFAAKQDIAMGVACFRVRATEIDGGGKPDLIVQTNSAVSILRNTSTVGSISFATKVDIGSGISSAVDLDVHDIDGDGKRDVSLGVTTTGNAYQVSVFRNTSTSGSVSFAAAVNFALPSFNKTLVAADFDGDGKPDLAAGTEMPNPGISLFLNTSSSGSITFAARKDIVSATHVGPNVFLTELNGDGKPDLAMTEGNTQFYLTENTSTVGNLSFATKVSMTQQQQLDYGNTADLDGDGKPDLIATLFNTNLLFVFKNSANEPSISGLSTRVAGTGSKVQITGTNLTNVSSVSFGGVAASSFSASDPTFMEATVAGGASGNVSVTTDKGTATYPGFTFSNRPIIHSNPSSIAVDETTYVSGLKFSETPSANIVRFGTVRATVVTATTNYLTVKVPAGAAYKPVTVTRGGLTGSGTYSFMTKFPDGSVAATSFGQKTDFTSAANPEGIAIGDFNNDGKNDMVAANPSTNNISVFINSGIAGAPAFQTHVEYATGTSPRRVAVDDFDNDGNLDIVVTNNGSSSVSVFRNTGSGTFDAKIDLTTNAGSFGVATNDIDGDGFVDIVVTNKTAGNISVLINTTTAGPISFATHADFAVQTQPASLSVGDLNRDGRPEIVVANTGSNSISVIANKSFAGTLSLASRIDFLIAGIPGAVVVSATNNEIQPDVIVLNQTTNNVVVLKTNSQGGLYTNFFNTVNFPTISGSQSMAVADVDGDSKPDIIVGGGNTVSVLRNTSPATFTLTLEPKVDYTAGAAVLDVAAGDLDSDGFPDFVTANSGGSNVSVIRNIIYNVTSISPLTAGAGQTVTIKGNSLTGATAVTFGGTNAASFTVVNSTTITAVLGAGSGGQVAVTTPMGTKTFSGFIYTNAPSITSYNSNIQYAGTDVTITGERFGATIAENIVRFGPVAAEITDASTTQLKVKVPVGATYAPLTVTANKLTGQSTTLFQLQNAPAADLPATSFGPKYDFATGDSPENLALGDFDNNGKTDLAVVNSGSNTVSVIENKSTLKNIVLSKFFDVETGGGPVAVAVADFDGDGKQDIAAANSVDNTVSIIRNSSVSGSTSFQFKVDYPTATNPQAIAVGDFDLDGRPDIVTANFTNSGSISILRNTSTLGISFAAKQDISMGSFTSSVAVGDLNRDGKLDIVVTNANSNNVSVLLNNAVGTIGFAPKVDYTVGNFPLSVVVGSTDGDLHLDIAATASSGNAITVLRNTGDGTFVPGNSPSSPTSPNYIAIGDLTGDAMQELVYSAGNSTLAFAKNSLGSGFSPHVSLTTAQDASGVAIADMNLDGAADIINTQQSGKVTVWPGLPASITFFEPLIGTQGTIVTINGTGFQNVTAVNFGGTAASSFTKVSSTKITAVVAGGSSGTVNLVSAVKTFSLDGFTYLPKPVISSFAPQNATTGMKVTINGANFTNVTAVQFGFVNAQSFTIVSSTVIEAIVGTGASGSVTVISGGVLTSLTGFFFLDPAQRPTITSFSPTTAGVGQSVTITGTNLSSINSVSFGGIAAGSFTINSTTSITAKVGAGATGSVDIAGPNGNATATGFTFDATVVGLEPEMTGSLYSLSVFPNPTPGREINFSLHQSWEGTNTIVEVTDMTGHRVISSALVCRELNKITVSEQQPIAAGFYLVSVMLGGKKVMAKMVVRD